MGSEQILYKYRGWNDNARRLLANREVYFASVDQLNDPFDCHIEPEFSPATRSDRLNHLRSHLAIQHPDWSEAHVFREALRLYPPGSAFPWIKSKQKWMRENRRSLNSQWGVFSLSRTPTDVLMWTHYANEHKGICVGISTVVLDNFISDLAQADGSVFCFRRSKVRYATERLKWNLFRDDGLEKLKSFLVTKSTAWKHEEEERILLALDRTRSKVRELTLDDRKRVLPHDAIREVWIGLNTPEEVQSEVKEILRHSKFPVRLKYTAREKDKYSLTALANSYRI